MVAVMIISVVIMALLEMQGNTTNMFSKLHDSIKTDQYTSLFIANKQYGFDKKSIRLDDLLNNFRVEDDLRRELKNTKVEISYKKLDYFDDEVGSEDKSETGNVLEIGRTTFKIGKLSTSMLRLKIQ